MEEKRADSFCPPSILGLHESTNCAYIGQNNPELVRSFGIQNLVPGENKKAPMIGVLNIKRHDLVSQVWGACHFLNWNEMLKVDFPLQAIVQPKSIQWEWSE